MGHAVSARYDGTFLALLQVAVEGLLCDRASSHGYAPRRAGPSRAFM